MSYVHLEVEHLTQRDYKQVIKKVTHDENKNYFTNVSYLQTSTVMLQA